LFVWQTINFIRVVNNLYILIFIFFELETIFEISVLDKEIKNSINKNSFNIVINTVLLVLNFEK